MCPPAAGRDKQDFAPWLGSYCCATETLEGQAWHIHPSGNQLHDGLVSSSGPSQYMFYVLQ